MINKSLLVAFIALLSSICVSAQTTKTIDRDKFSMQYPANWTIDTEDEDYDPDALFSIDAPDDNGMVMFIIIDLAVDLEEMLNKQEKEIKKQLMKKPAAITNFTKWGSFTGKGKTYKGNILGVMNGVVNVFACHVGNRTFYVMEQLFDETLEETKEQASVISSSFKFK